MILCRTRVTWGRTVMGRKSPLSVGSSFFGMNEVFPQRSSGGNSPKSNILLYSLVITGMSRDLNMPPSIPRGSLPAPADGRQCLT
uniref:Uncharacterized protein n=1 Tax=Lepeophtheirus salmonis TaxID=72036 RepID=A0A0K2US38_LEPSM